MRKVEAKVVKFGDKALAAPSSVKLQKQTLLKQFKAKKRATYIGYLD